MMSEVVHNSKNVASPEPSLTSFMQGSFEEVDEALVHERFEQQVEQTPDCIAVELAGETLSYRDLNERANQLAHFLRRKGVRPGVFVGVSFERSLNLLVAIYAVLKAGGAYVPLDPSYPVERLRRMAGGANLKFLLTQEACAKLFTDLSPIELVFLDSQWHLIAGESACNPVPMATGDDIIYVIFTSGSTGQPKAAAVYHRGFSNLLHWFVSEFEITEKDHALLVSSVSFDLTQKNLYATLLCGGTLHLYPPGPYDLVVLAKLIREHEITLINCTPSAFYPLVHPFDESSIHSLASLRVVFLGGEPISISRIEAWINHPNCRAEVANTYGPTECTDICGFYRLTSENLHQYNFVPLGRPIYNVQMAIVDEALALCPVGVAGELCIGGAGVGAGYLNDAAMTTEKFIKNPFQQIASSLLYRTGDQARWHADGVIEFLGRMDHQVKIRGFRIELNEIEAALNSHPEVREAIVIVKAGSSDADHQLVCCFVPNSGIKVSREKIREFLSERLPSHMVPNLFEEFDRFPLSPNGKVDRSALAKLLGKSTDEPARQMLKIPLKGIEQVIHSLWCEVLNRTEIGIEENFFDLGGDSLLLAQLHLRLQEQINCKFPITILFAHTNIKSMTNYFIQRDNENKANQTVQDRARQQRKALLKRKRDRS